MSSRAMNAAASTSSLLMPRAPGLESSPLETVSSLGAGLCVGDIVCIHVTAKPFREVAAATGSWINHVGIVFETAGEEPLIAESTFPFSRLTRLSRFVARSQGGRVAVARLRQPLTSGEAQQVRVAARRRMGVFYDTGFKLNSRRQFCSRYVREVIGEATGIEIGDIETFATLYSRRPQAELRFWKLWYFGRIPWKRETVTPVSLLRSPQLRCLFDGVVKRDDQVGLRVVAGVPSNPSQPPAS